MPVPVTYGSPYILWWSRFLIGLPIVCLRTGCEPVYWGKPFGGDYTLCFGAAGMWVELPHPQWGYGYGCGHGFDYQHLLIALVGLSRIPVNKDLLVGRYDYGFDFGVR